MLALSLFASTVDDFVAHTAMLDAGTPISPRTALSSYISHLSRCTSRQALGIDTHRVHLDALKVQYDALNIKPDTPAILPALDMLMLLLCSARVNRLLSRVKSLATKLILLGAGREPR